MSSWVRRGVAVSRWKRAVLYDPLPAGSVPQCIQVLKVLDTLSGSSDF